MSETRATNSISWLEETYSISDEKYNPENDQLLQSFHDSDKIEEIIKIIEDKKFTVKELESLIWEIKLENMRKELNEYLDILKKSENDIIKRLIKKWLIDKNLEQQTIKLKFKWTTFQWISKEMMNYLTEYNLNRWSFRKELEKVDDDKAIYSINIVIEKGKNNFITKDIYIKKED